MRLSIIIPNFNSGDLLRDSLISISKLSSKVDLDIIIVDNNSSDNPSNIIEDFSHLHIIFVSEVDRGIYDAMNKGLDFASGTWVYFLGSGDIIKFKNFSKSLFFGEYDYFYGKIYDCEKSSVIGNRVNLFHLFRYGICHQSIFYKKSIFDYYRYDLEYPIQADLVMNIFLFSSIKFKGMFVDVILCDYLGRGISSKFRDEKFRKGKIYLLGLNLFKNFTFLNFLYSINYLKFKLFSRF
ncbi:glycosyltransferase [Algoriphagus sp. C2-6-M1]|uniref:glycosyltransferase n=1 Tax=Algoriphagus persicinus TaxID=3108754 RepID=UPI002B3C8F57|nr:glycosyltransferase [Algoriphagus sp. C2-6-M1]MEB2782422.1 glycosyltransferase [Algoriphagus sp. C2-6-M1]